jgi:23S rRNA (adenine2030-N6)-methyltransferase
VNYRHAFHAGNVADVVKHAVLVQLIEQMRQKDTAFCYLDTHAGQGRYDLRSEAADKTGEFRDGIAKLLAAPTPPPALARYLELVRTAQPSPGSLQIYPGSPALVQALLRPQDRAILVELHPEDCAVLRAQFRDDTRIHVHHRDGYEALPAFVPPRERRGLVLIDPPYEARDELPALVATLQDAHKRWPTGQFAIWYPIKDQAPIEQFHGALANTGLRKLLTVELVATPERALRGSGLVLVNPPWRIADALVPLLDQIAAALGRPDAARRVDWLVPE